MFVFQPNKGIFRLTCQQFPDWKYILVTKVRLPEKYQQESSFSHKSSTLMLFLVRWILFFFFGERERTRPTERIFKVVGSLNGSFVKLTAEFMNIRSVTAHWWIAFMAGWNLRTAELNWSELNWQSTLSLKRMFHSEHWQQYCVPLPHGYSLIHSVSVFIETDFWIFCSLTPFHLNWFAHCQN